MDIAVFSTTSFDRQSPAPAAAGQHELRFLEPHLTRESAVLARGVSAVCAFVNVQVNADVLAELKPIGGRLVALRSAGYNTVDLDAARRHGITIPHVPAYSPDAVGGCATGWARQ